MRYSVIFVVLALTIAATGCGHKHDKEYVVQTIEVPTPAPTPTEQEDISRLVADFQSNTSGSALLQQGLTCRLYKNDTNPFPANDNQLPLGTQHAVWTYVGGFWQGDSPTSDGLNVLPYALRINPMYQNYYAMTCSGYLVVTQADYKSFELRSDDASQLKIDGAMVIDNGGNHGPTNKVGSKFLTRGVHTFQLNYYQLNGTQSLQLNVGGQYLYTKGI